MGQSTQLNVSGFAGRYTACSCNREASCSMVHPQTRTRSWMRSSWRRRDLAAASSSRASAQEAALLAELQCRAQRVAFVQLAISSLRARQAEQEMCYQLCTSWAD